MNEWLSELGGAGVLAAALIWVFRTFVPRLLERQDKALAEQRADFKEMESQQREAFLAASGRAHTRFEALMKELVAEQKAQRQTQTEMVAVMTETTTTMRALDSTMRGQQVIAEPAKAAEG